MTRAAKRASARSAGVRLAQVRPADRLLIVCLRRWLGGAEGQQAVWNGLAGQLGTHHARRVLGSFEAFLRSLTGGRIRELTRHTVRCACLGDDEALIAEIVRAAGRGDHDVAVARAAEIVRAADLTIMVERAARLGRLLDEIGNEPASAAEARARLH